jgi:hypothetical protein
MLAKSWNFVSRLPQTQLLDFLPKYWSTMKFFSLVVALAQLCLAAVAHGDDSYEPNTRVRGLKGEGDDKGKESSGDKGMPKATTPPPTLPPALYPSLQNTLFPTVGASEPGMEPGGTETPTRSYYSSSKASYSKASKGKGKSKGGKGEFSAPPYSKGPKKITHPKSSKSSKSKMEKISSKSSKIGKGGPYTTKHPTKKPTPGGPTRVPTVSYPTRMPSVPGTPTVVLAPTKSPTPGGPCLSSFANYVLTRVPEVIVTNPRRCCDYDGPTAAFVTHAFPSNATQSGFEKFWDEYYATIDAATNVTGTCFFMTGVDPNKYIGRDLSQILISTNQIVSGLEMIPAMMATDPTDTSDLMEEVRSISNDPAKPSIGIFNSGYQNVVIESLISGLARIPYIGYLQDEMYGAKAASITLDLLDNVRPEAICFNARPSLSFFAQRCAAYYKGLNFKAPQQEQGVSCSSNTPAEDFARFILNKETNAIWSHGDCCLAAAQGAAIVRQQTGRVIVVGCMDEDTSGGLIHFVTTQPVRLQATQATTWTNFPVIKQLMGGDGRLQRYFPNLQSLAHTAIYNILLL